MTARNFYVHKIAQVIMLVGTGKAMQFRDWAAWSLKVYYSMEAHVEDNFQLKVHNKNMTDEMYRRSLNLVGPDRLCSPHRVIPYNARNEGLHRGG